MVIDGLLVLAAFVGPTTMLKSVESTWVLRIAIAMLAIFGYEPLCTGRYFTLGQWMTGVRVRPMDNGHKVGVVRAWGRIVLKAFLGILSFLILPFVPGRRAIDDLASGSIVTLARSEADFAQWAVEREAEREDEIVTDAESSLRALAAETCRRRAAGGAALCPPTGAHDLVPEVGVEPTRGLSLTGF
jgi:hypothetical protein